MKKRETVIRNSIRAYLKQRGWFVIVTHGNLYQFGLPDLYACRNGKARWIEVKQGKRYKFTNAQLYIFPELENQGIGVWVLTDATYEEYAKLFQAPNWRDYARQ